MSRVRTLRGILPAGATKRLILDDGRYLNGFKVKSFRVWSPTWSNQCSAILSYSENAPSQADASDGNQIGWANYNDSTTNATDAQAFLDPDHVVQQDLFIHGTGAILSFLIELEPIAMTANQGLLQLIKASRQDEP
jgi:hypothetical protein